MSDAEELPGPPPPSSGAAKDNVDDIYDDIKPAAEEDKPAEKEHRSSRREGDRDEQRGSRKDGDAGEKREHRERKDEPRERRDGERSRRDERSDSHRERDDGSRRERDNGRERDGDRRGGERSRHSDRDETRSTRHEDRAAPRVRSSRDRDEPRSSRVEASTRDERPERTAVRSSRDRDERGERGGRHEERERPVRCSRDRDERGGGRSDRRSDRDSDRSVARGHRDVDNSRSERHERVDREGRSERDRDDRRSRDRGDNGRESGRESARDRDDRAARYDAGYVPRRRGQRRDSPDNLPKFVDPFAALRAANAAQGMSAKTNADAKLMLQEQQMKARQLVLQQQATSAAAAASKTQREVYIGNLTQGKVTDQALRQLFDSALSTAFPDIAQGHAPCLNVAMHSEGRYAFVELATPAMATAALQLSGQLDFLGSQITVGRPSGYIDPAKAAAAAAAATKALQEYGDPLTGDGAGSGVLKPGDAPPAVPGPTPCLCIDNMVRDVVFAEEEEYQGLMEDLQMECGKDGRKIQDIRVPRPVDPATQLGEGCYGKAYVMMESARGAAEVQREFHGRMYDGLSLEVTFIHPGLFYQLQLS